MQVGRPTFGKSTSPTTELRERPMHDCTNLPVLERTGIPGDCATLFVSVELSRSTWVATSLAPGSKKMSKHTLAGASGRVPSRALEDKSRATHCSAGQGWG